MRAEIGFVMCRCGRARATVDDLASFRAVLPIGHPFAGAPSTWQMVRLGVCLPPDCSHLDVPAELLTPCWSLTDCRLPVVQESRMLP